jgi:hypothetical protein
MTTSAFLNGGIYKALIKLLLREETNLPMPNNFILISKLSYFA